VIRDNFNQEAPFACKIQKKVFGLLLEKTLPGAKIAGRPD